MESFAHPDLQSLLQTLRAQMAEAGRRNVTMRRLQTAIAEDSERAIARSAATLVRSDGYFPFRPEADSPVMVQPEVGEPDASAERRRETRLDMAQRRVLRRLGEVAQQNDVVDTLNQDATQAALHLVVLERLLAMAVAERDQIARRRP